MGKGNLALPMTGNDPRMKMARVIEEKWNAAFEAVKSHFKVPDLLPKQREFLQGKSVL